MQIYLVGGAVRDALMGLPVKDRDWVVVGATPDQMLAQGFILVGRDFPVFLHPSTHEQYALARTERKTGPGYHGFAVYAAPDVTLQDDLARRDLTLNAMAVEARHLCLEGQADSTDWASVRAAGHVLDPFGGQQDVAQKVLRHVSSAFAEDPVRILRLARFAARWPDFAIAPQTQALMRAMVANGEVSHLVAERVWQELAQGLMADRPSRMLEVLRDCDALVQLMPELDRLWGVPQRADHHPEVDTGIHTLMTLDMSARLQAPLAVRFACLCHDLGKGTTPPQVLPRHHGHEQRSVLLLRGLCQRLRVPHDCRELADLVAREHSNVHRSDTLDAAGLVRLLERCDALRLPGRFAEMLMACECDARGRLGHQQSTYVQSPLLLECLAAAQGIAAKEIAANAMAKGACGLQVGQILHQARVAAVHQALLAR